MFRAVRGDKTQLATLALASGERGAKWAVFIGSALAPCTTSAIAVAGAAFVVLGVVYLWPRKG